MSRADDVLDALHASTIQLIENGRLDEAFAESEKAIARADSVFGKQHLEYAISLNNKASTLTRAGRGAAAVPLFEEALAICAALSEQPPADYLFLFHRGAADAYMQAGQMAPAKEQYQIALSTARTMDGSTPELIAMLANNLGFTALKSADYKTAETSLQEAVGLIEKLSGRDSADYGNAVNNLADVYRNVGRYRDANPLYDEALKSFTAALSSDHLAMALVSYCAGLSRMGSEEFTKSETLLRSAAEIYRKKVGEQNADYAACRKSLGDLYSKTGRTKESIHLLTEALAVFDEQLGATNQLSGSTLNSRGVVLLAVRRVAEARDDFARAEAIYRQLGLMQTPDYGLMLGNLAVASSTLGDSARALPLFRKALPIMEATLGPDHPTYAGMLSSYADACTQAGEYSSAEQALKRAIAVLEASSGASNPMYVNILFNQANLYATVGRFPEAESLYRKVLSIAEPLGKTNELYTCSLSGLGLSLLEQGRLADARAPFDESVSLSRQAGRTNDYAFATLLSNQALLLYREERHREAKPLFEQAIPIIAANIGTDNPRYASLLLNLGSVESELAEFAAAESNIVRACEIIRASAGQTNMTYVGALNNLALFQQMRGEPQKAAEACRQGIALCEQAGGTQHPMYAVLKQNLAIALLNLGRTDEAISTLEELTRPSHFATYPHREPVLNTLANAYVEAARFDEAKSIFTSLVMDDHGALRSNSSPTTICNLAGLYHSLADYAAAERLYKQALERIAARKGKEHPDYARVLNGYGVLCSSMGKSEESIALYREASEIAAKVWGYDHPDFALYLVNHASALVSAGYLHGTDGLFARALEIFRKTRADSHPLVASTLSQRGRLQKALGDYQAAEKYYQEAAEIRRATLGEAHPDYAESMNELAGIYGAMGRYEDARTLLMRALNGIEKALGKSNPSYAQMLSNLAELEVEAEQPESALEHAREAWTQFLSLRDQILDFATEKEMGSYLRTLTDEINRNYSICANELSTLDGAAVFAADTSLSSKGIILQTLAQRQQSAQVSKDPKVKALRDELAAASRELSQALRHPPAGEAAAAAIQELEQRVQRADVAVARASQSHAEISRERGVTLEDISRSLQPDEALVDFVRYRRCRPGWSGLKGQWGDDEYFALLVRGVNGSPNVALYALGSATNVEAAVSAWRQLAGIGDSSAADLTEKSALLHRLVWMPLLPSLDGIRKVYICPDAELSFVSFGALPGKTPGSYLVEDLDLAYVSSGRDLVSTRTRSSGSPALLGDPDFGGAPTADSDGATRAGNLAVAIRAGLRSEGFTPLPGTRKEVEQVEQLLHVRKLKPAVLLGPKATESAVRAIRRPSLLHLATHGFYLPESGIEEALLTTPTRGMSVVAAPGDATSSPDPLARFLTVDNPMQRSGVALAGANDLLGGAARDPTNDGMLTAAEITGLDFQGTDLVTISACQSGLGDVSGGEGVYGLRRAFALAGVHHLVMSLWSVPDAETAALMGAFYSAYEYDTTPQRALLKAQRDWIAQQRSAHRFPHPFAWAAFIANGSGVSLQ